MRRPSPRPPASRHDDDPDDPAEVPAAVLCVRCGRAECSGCTSVNETAHSTPPVTPWEAGNGGFSNLWKTAQLVTVEGKSFFGMLHAGSLGRAFFFALMSELLAVGSLLVAWVILMRGAFPTALAALVGLAPSPWIAIGIAAATVVVVATLMVVLHAVWAASLEMGIRLSGRDMEMGHALKYALYSCGWDLVTSPFGLCAGLVSGGPRRALGELRQAIKVPGEATRAYLRVARSTPQSAARRSIWLAATVTGGLVFSICAGLLVGIILVSV